jgi:hypothetical protein
MTAVIVILLVLALIAGGVGLVIEGLMWLLLIALLFVVVSAIVGFVSRGRVTR